VFGQRFRSARPYQQRQMNDESSTTVWYGGAATSAVGAFDQLICDYELELKCQKRGCMSAIASR